MVGDNQTEVEGPIAYEQIKGVMTAVIKNNKTIYTDNIWYALAGRIWLILRPVRMCIARPVAAFKRKVKKIIGQ